MHVIAGAFANFAQQRSVDPVHDGAIQFARTVKAQPVLIEVGDENILYLQIAARMEQGNRIGKTLQRARTQ